jgi:amino acid transporter
MARDHQLPGSRPLARVAPKLHTPVWACIVIAVLAAVPFIQYSGAAYIAIAATGMIYFSYFLGNLAIMRARTRGWPKTKAPFRLGRWGLLVNGLALLYGGAMLVNFAWPRVASNPKPDQTAGLLHFGLSFLNRIPILWTVAVGIAVIGVLYYLIAGRRQPFTPVLPPPEETPPEEAPAAEVAP